ASVHSTSAPADVGEDEFLMPPPPQGNVVSGDGQLRDVVMYMRALSRRATETDDEKRLEFRGFPPGFVLSKVLRSEVLPSGLLRFAKKRAWCPKPKRKDEPDELIDAAVVRFTNGPWTVQVVDTRRATTIILRSKTRDRIIDPSEIASRLPDALYDILKTDVLEGARVVAHSEAHLSDGTIAVLLNVLLSRPLQMESSCSSRWVTVFSRGNVISIAMEKSYAIASPNEGMDMSLFDGPRQQSVTDAKDLVGLAEQGPSAAGELARRVRDEMDSSDGAVAPEMRRRRVVTGLSLLSELAEEAQTASTGPRHDCWRAALSCASGKRAALPEAHNLAGKMLKLMAASGRTEDVSLLKELILSPEFIAYSDEGLNVLSSAIGTADMQNWCVAVLRGQVQAGNVNSRLTVSVLNATPGQFADDHLRFVSNVVRITEDEVIRRKAMENLVCLSEAALAFRLSTVAGLRRAVTSSDKAIIFSAIQGLQHCGDASSLWALQGRLATQDADIRRRAERATRVVLEGTPAGTGEAVEVPTPSSDGTELSAKVRALLGNLDPSAVYDVPAWNSRVNELERGFRRKHPAGAVRGLLPDAERPDLDKARTLEMLGSVPACDDACPAIADQILQQNPDANVGLAAVNLLNRCGASLKYMHEAANTAVRRSSWSNETEAWMSSVLAARAGHMGVLSLMLQNLSGENRLSSRAAVESMGAILGISLTEDQLDDRGFDSTVADIRRRCGEGGVVKQGAGHK
ncbi:MAG: hypothetical protein WBL15_07695, partial [Phycisphaerae bacterium]